MFSEIENPADKINENLPPQIRILGKILKHKTRMHSSRMCTAHLLTVFRSIQLGGLLNPPPGCRPPGCRPPPRCRPHLWMLTPLDADPLGHVTYNACWESSSPPLNRMLVKILPCPKLRLRAVKIGLAKYS